MPVSLFLSKDFHKGNRVISGDEVSAVFDTFLYGLLVVGTEEEHWQTLGLEDREYLGVHNLHRNADGVVIAVGVGLKFLHLKIGVAQNSAAVGLLDIFDHSGIEAVEPAVFKQAVLLQQGDGTVYAVFCIHLKLNAQMKLGIFCNHKLQKIPYMLVVGDRDMENGTVSVRTRKGDDLGAMTPDEFIAKCLMEIATKSKEV